MSMYVNTNVSSLNAQRQLFNTSNSLNTSFERLSSGSRINSASDDAAGLQISNRMTAQIQGLNQGVRNANDGISVLQTAEGALDETTNSLQRIRQLAVQSNNGVNSTEDKEALKQEIDALKLEMDRIATDTEFNGVALLDGSYGADFQVGAEGGQSINVTIDNGTASTGFDSTDLAIAGDVTAAGGADTLIGEVDAALELVGAARAEMGATQNRFESSIRNLSNISENLSGARSRIKDTDFATETANLTRNQIMQQASLSVLSQANQRPQAALSLLG
ncbi:flagellin N-terminal helical domain-containing protein [Salinimonas chungwhensis]|uniref:flagellin N-terminal helical domain-containing protein n=1 Tax=Salinimonas chungwhensis TaxID=265425 RepID=UPI0003611D04|nr:flagellin [Salinimonas chungwhensis]